jgi:acid phosphatase type 7
MRRWVGKCCLVTFAALAFACTRGPPKGDAGACVPRTCSVAGKACGTQDDGCGTALSCGVCADGETCGGSGTLNLCGSPTETTAPVVVAVGDISCSLDDAAFDGGAGTADKCHQAATAALAAQVDPAAVLLLGDIQYPSGEREGFLNAFHPAWGALKPRIRPAVGNHEYGTAGAAGYFSYFGATAGKPDQGYYSFDLGAWHVVTLNSNCSEVGGCGEGSPQLAWLKADLAANARTCTLAFWHHPRFSSGEHGNDLTVTPFWDALIAAGADLVLTGHDHHYERFAPQSASGQPDPDHGMRELLVGTGGKSLYPLDDVPQPNSQVRFNGGYGVLKLRLRTTGYDWEFLAEPGQTFTDSGASECH